MEEAVSKLRGHIPDDIMQENINLDKFLKIFDGLMKVKKDNVFYYIRNFMYPLVHDIRIMRRYVDEWKAEYTEQSTRFCIDCLYRNYFEIYSRKGTKIGLKKLLTCLFWVDEEPDITIDTYVMGKPLILFDDDRAYDWLPEDTDIAGEILSPAGSEIWCPTLLDDTWDYCMATLTITIDINYTPTPEFLEFIKSVIVLYLPMISPNFIVINLNII